MEQLELSGGSRASGRCAAVVPGSAEDMYMQVVEEAIIGNVTNIDESDVEWYETSRYTHADSTVSTRQVVYRGNSLVQSKAAV